MASAEGLRRQLGFTAVTAIVAGDMLGSGVFFTPGELAAVARASWQVYLFWALAGAITLCGALTLAELSSLLPRSGASFHIIREGFGPFWAFVKIWMEMWVSGPGSTAGVAIVFGTYFSAFIGMRSTNAPVLCGVAAICVLAAINLMGVTWGGWTQIVLTAVKAAALLALVGGTLLVVGTTPAAESSLAIGVAAGSGFFALIKLIGLGLGAVMFTYDGWVDATHVTGEVINPARNMSSGLLCGVGSVIAIYLLVNYAYLRVVSLADMREAPTLIASRVAERVFGPAGGTFVTSLIMISIFGALGGLVMTFPRLVFSAAARYKQIAGTRNQAHRALRLLSAVSARTAVPAGAIVFSAVMSCVALAFFGSFSRIVNFIVVPAQAINILMVASIYRLRRRPPPPEGEIYRAPGYPVTPLIYIVVMSAFLASAVYYQPVDTCIGIAITCTSLPVFWWIGRKDLT